MYPHKHLENEESETIHQSIRAHTDCEYRVVTSVEMRKSRTYQSVLPARWDSSISASTPRRHFHRSTVLGARTVKARSSFLNRNRSHAPLDHTYSSIDNLSSTLNLWLRRIKGQLITNRIQFTRGQNQDFRQRWTLITRELNFVKLIARYLWNKRVDSNEIW